VWQEQRASLCPGIFDDHAHKPSQQAIQMCLSGNGLRGFEETADVKGVSPHAGRMGCGSKMGVAGLEIRDFGVCAPAGVCGAGVAQVVVGEAGLPARQIELGREFVCQRFVIKVAVPLRQGNGGIIVFARFRSAALHAGTFRFDQMELM
jgi:hypothetical protein